MTVYRHSINDLGDQMVQDALVWAVAYLWILYKLRKALNIVYIMGSNTTIV